MALMPSELLNSQIYKNFFSKMRQKHLHVPKKFPQNSQKQKN